MVDLDCKTVSSLKYYSLTQVHWYPGFTNQSLYLWYLGPDFIRGCNSPFFVLSVTIVLTNSVRVFVIFSLFFFFLLSSPDLCASWITMSWRQWKVVYMVEVEMYRTEICPRRVLVIRTAHILFCKMFRTVSDSGYWGEKSISWQKKVCWMQITLRKGR